MRLGIDVDGVVLDSVPLYRAAFEKRGYTTDNETVFPFSEVYGTTPEVTEEIFREVEQITDVPLIPGVQLLNKIVELPHIESPIHFVSSRHLDSYCPTFRALDHHFSFEFNLWCGEMAPSKGEFCKAAELDFFVEDGPPHIRDIYWNSGARIYVLDKPYNQEIDFHVNVLRVKNWDEILIDLQREGYREATTQTDSILH